MNLRVRDSNLAVGGRTASRGAPFGYLPDALNNRNYPGTVAQSIICLEEFYFKDELSELQRHVGYG